MTDETAPLTATRRTDYVPLDDLVPNPANPKGHDFETIDASVGRFGYVEPVVMDDRTGYLISGHGRRETLLAMRDRGESAPEGIGVQDDGTWLVPVSRGWASRTDTEATAALIALNRTTELGGWVDDALLGMLDTLAADELSGGEGLLGVGYDEGSIETLRARLAAEEVVDSFDPSASGDEYDDEGEPIESFGVSAGTVEVVVVVKQEDRERLYALLHEQEYVTDVRDRLVR